MNTVLKIVTTILSLLANSPTVVLASPAAAGGVPGGVAVRTTNQVRSRELPVVDMIWNGPITPGAPINTTLTGTAKSIYEQLIVLNPNYLADFSIQDPTAAAASAARLTRRGDNDDHHMHALEARETGTVRCDRGNSVFTDECNEGISYLRALGTASCGANGNSCSRVSCSWGCGIFLCSTIPGTWQGYCQDIAYDVDIIKSHCKEPTPQPGGRTEFEGQLSFSDHYTRVYYDSC